MIVTPKIFARLVAIAVLAVLLQLSFFSRVELFHTSIDILPAVVASLGLLGGSMAGAVAGFSIGFLVDCLLVAPLGGTSLVLLGAGYLAGLFRERFEIHSALVPALVCMGLTLCSELGFAAVQVMLGVDAPVSSLVLRDMALTEDLLRCIPASLVPLEWTPRSYTRLAALARWLTLQDRALAGQKRAALCSGTVVWLEPRAACAADAGAFGRDDGAVK